MAHPRGQPPGAGRGRGRQPVHRHGAGNVAGRQERRDPERLVLVAVQRLRPWAVVAGDPLRGAQERRELLPGQRRGAGADPLDPRAVRPVARLVQRRVPGPQQAVPRAAPERVGQHVVQERGQHQLRGHAQQPLAQPHLGPPVGRDPADQLRLDGGERRQGVVGEEPADRGQERDRGRLRGGQAVQLVGREPRDPVQEPRQPFGRVAADQVGPGGPAMPGRCRGARARLARPRHPRRARAVSGPPDPRRRRDPQPEPLLVVAGAQVRVAQPVVGDVDPLREVERRGVLAGDVRVVALEERTPGELDGLGRCVDRHLEAGVQVVVGDQLGRHAAQSTRAALRPATGPCRSGTPRRPRSAGSSSPPSRGP